MIDVRACASVVVRCPEQREEHLEGLPTDHFVGHRRGKVKGLPRLESHGHGAPVVSQDHRLATDPSAYSTRSASEVGTAMAFGMTALRSFAGLVGAS